MRLFNDGAPGVPVIEFSSEGEERSDATNEIKISQVNIYGSRGPGFVIRNNGKGVVRNITVEALRVEGSEQETTEGDLLIIGDPVMRGGVSNIMFSNLELLDPTKGHAALRLTAPGGGVVPYQSTVRGLLG